MRLYTFDVRVVILAPETVDAVEVFGSSSSWSLGVSTYAKVLGAD